MREVSVIIPCYNRERLIGQTLDSVLEQSYPVKEVLVVDDGSKDGTRQVVREYEKKSGGVVRLLEQKNSGPSAARNHGLKEAKGELIALMDADDVWLRQKIGRQVEALEEKGNEKVAGVYGRMFLFEKELDDRQRKEPQNQVDCPTLEHLILTMCIQSSTVLMRREAVEGVWFDPSIRAAEDALFFAEVGLMGKQRHGLEGWRLVDEALTGYRVHGAQLTHEGGHAVDTTVARVGWCRQMAGQGRLEEGRARALEGALWKRLVGYAERMYWKRQVEEVKDLRQKLRELCPKELEKSFLGGVRIYPKWVYGMRDCFSKREVDEQG